MARPHASLFCFFFLRTRIVGITNQKNTFNIKLPTVKRADPCLLLSSFLNGCYVVSI